MTVSGIVENLQTINLKSDLEFVHGLIKVLNRGLCDSCTHKGVVISYFNSQKLMNFGWIRIQGLQIVL